jgi:site-specific recombinase XerD
MTQETIKGLVPKFGESLKTLGRSPATLLAYRADLEQLVDFLLKKNKPLPEQVRPDDLEAFRDTLSAQKYTAKSVSRKLNAVKTFFKWVVTSGVLSTNPAATVAHPKIETSIPKFLSQIEYRALRDLTRGDARIAAIVELILQTGMRISEVAALKTEDIQDKSARISAYATQPERTIPLNKPAKEALSTYLNSRPKIASEYVFISKTGKPLAVRNIRAAVDRYMQKAEIGKFSVNDLRTTFIVENIKAGVDLVLLSQVTGHKRLSTTEKYLELAGISAFGKGQILKEL